jgi:hypothetical protein
MEVDAKIYKKRVERKKKIEETAGQPSLTRLMGSRKLQHLQAR